MGCCIATPDVPSICSEDTGLRIEAAESRDRRRQWEWRSVESAVSPVVGVVEGHKGWPWAQETGADVAPWQSARP